MPGKRFCLLLVLMLGLIFTAGCAPRANLPVRSASWPENRGLFDLQNQMANLEGEIKRLHGELEEQGHRLEQINKHQRDLSVDVDQRLQALEGRGGTASSTPTEANPPLETLQSSPDSEWTIVEEEGEAPALSIENQSTPHDTLGPAASSAPESSARAAAPAQNSSAVAMAYPAGERESYQQAFEFLKTGRYDQALAAFNDFLARFPSGSYADNAQYWLGETYYVRRQFTPAIAEYEKLVQSYPQSQKLSHALLKLGYSYYELGQIDQAKATLQDLKNRYPGTAAARLAEERLQRINLERP